MFRNISTVHPDEMKDEFIGKQEREKYEYDLNMEVLSIMIRKVRKVQISKPKSRADSATTDTVLRVFKALKAEIRINVKIENQYPQLT